MAKQRHHTSYKDGSHKSSGAHQDHGAEGSSHFLHVNPDHGHPMIEGEMKFNKGYQEQHGNDSPYYPEDHMRGNDYAHLQNEIAHRDEKKLKSAKFSKIA